MKENRQEQQNILLVQKDERMPFDSKKVLGQIIEYWWVYAVSLALAIILPFIYLRYTTPSYKIQAKILVKDSKKGGNMSQTDMLEEIGLTSGPNSVDNEVE